MAIGRSNWRLAWAAFAAVLSALVAARPAPLGAQANPAAGWMGPAPHVTGSAENVWADVDYLVWHVEGMHLPTLVRTNPIGTPNADVGLDGGTTTDVLGNEEVGNNWRSGAHLSGGIWLDPWQEVAVVGDFLDAGNDGFDRTIGPSSSAFISRPVTNAATGLPDRSIVNIPGDTLGMVRVQVDDELQSAGVGLQTMVYRESSCYDDSRWLRIDLVGGYRYFHYDTGLSITENRVGIAPGNVGQSEVGLDQFVTGNEFHGGELGLEARVHQDRWWIEGLAKLAVGGNRRHVDIRGYTVNATNLNFTAMEGGNLYTAESTNAGRHADAIGTVIPEFRIGLGCFIMPRLSARIGYHVIIWDDVVQAASELPFQLATDPRNIPPVTAGGGVHPAFPGLWERTVVAHGVDLGLELAY